MAVAEPPLIAVVGPTASGKTDLALALAHRLPVEVLVADSRQVYRGMDIGTAKPSVEARAEIPHHLLDLVDPNEPFSVAQWVAAARAVVPEIAARGRMPMVVGGTGLFVDALLQGHDYASQGWSPEVRVELTARLESEGIDGLVAALTAADPEAAGRIDRRNPRRVLRALERALASGAGSAPTVTAYRGRIAMLGLSRPRDVLYRRIDERAHALFTAEGLLDEVRGLIARGHGVDLPPMSGHGYREAARHLAGEWSIEQAIDVTARRTRQYAKRQLTWFRRDPRIVWLPAGDRPADDPRLVEEADRVIRSAVS